MTGYQTLFSGSLFAKSRRCGLYDAQGLTFFYWLKPFQQAIVDNNHDVYEIGDVHIRRLRQCVLEPDSTVR